MVALSLAAAVRSTLCATKGDGKTGKYVERCIRGKEADEVLQVVRIREKKGTTKWRDCRESRSETRSRLEI